MSADNEVEIELWVHGDVTPDEVSKAIAAEADWLTGPVDRDLGRDPLRIPSMHRVVTVLLEQGQEENGTATLVAAVSRLEPFRVGLKELSAKAHRVALRCDLGTYGVWESYFKIDPPLLRRIADLGLTLDIIPTCYEREAEPTQK